ncbi:flagellar hook-basal body complex protein FliE [Salmonella enterica]
MRDKVVTAYLEISRMQI